MRKSLCVITYKEFRYSPLNSIRMMCDFINYGTDYICDWEPLKENICDAPSENREWELALYRLSD